MEKRRRARINQYLDELKNFILVNEKDVSEIFSSFYVRLSIAQNIDQDG